MYKYFKLFFFLMAAVQMAQSQGVISNSAKMEKWTPEHYITTRYILSKDFADSVVGKYSKDGRYISFITYKGNLEKDRIEQTIHLFQTSKILATLIDSSTLNGKPLQPDKKISMDIDSWMPFEERYTRWSDDGKSLVFFETDFLKEKLKLNKVNLDNDRREEIYSWDFKGSPPQADIIDINATGSSALFASIEYPSIPLPEAQYPEIHLETDNLYNLMGEKDYREEHKNCVFHNNKVFHLSYELEVGEAWMSPSGNYFVTLQPNKGDSLIAKKTLDPGSVPSNVSRLYMLVNSEQPEKLVPIARLENAGDNQAQDKKQLFKAIWMSDEKSVILINAVALNKDDSVKNTPSILWVNTLSGERLLLEKTANKYGALKDVDWNSETNTLTLVYLKTEKPNQTRIVLKYSKGVWKKGKAESFQGSLNGEGTNEEFKLEVQQDLNTPPLLMAVKGDKRIPLMEKDPALANVYIAPTKTINWKLADGTPCEGGLTLPNGYDGKSPLPLVIPFYTYEPNLFQPTGGTTSGYSVQALAAQGYAVLQIDQGTDIYIKTYKNVKEAIRDVNKWGHLELTAIRESIDNVVLMLSDQGIVDKNKVGLVGFSRAGFNTLYTVTHPGKIKIAAAIDLDGWTGSFNNYLLSGSRMSLKEWERIYGGNFWMNKEKWQEQVPSFNVDKVNTPILFSVHSKYGSDGIRSVAYGYAEIIGAFNLNHKPYDFLYYPKGLHNLLHPKEIYAATNTTIDWMNFWLKGLEDPNPAKAERYVRWRKLKIMQK